MNLGNLFREARKAAGITRAQASARAGISATTAKQIESAEFHRSSWRNLSDYAEACGTTLPALVRKQPSPSGSVLDQVRALSKPVETLHGRWLVDLAILESALSAESVTDCPAMSVTEGGTIRLSDVEIACGDHIVSVGMEGHQVVERAVMAKLDGLAEQLRRERRRRR